MLYSQINLYFFWLLVKDGNGIHRSVWIDVEKYLLFQKSTVPRCISCKVCTPFHGIQQFQLGKRGGPLYKMVKAAEKSQLLPVDVIL